jgi:hypothetical protein
MGLMMLFFAIFRKQILNSAVASEAFSLVWIHGARYRERERDGGGEVGGERTMHVWVGNELSLFASKLTPVFYITSAVWH